MLTGRAATAYVGLGGNLDAPRETLDRALETLAALADVTHVVSSRFFRTAPIDAQGPDFCNAVARLTTHHDPRTLLKHLLDIELRFGRTRPHHNAPRTLDLDLIAFDQTVLVTPDLTLPHPRAHMRAFVLIPLCELDPHVALGPVHGPMQEATVWHDMLDPRQTETVMPW